MILSWRFVCCMFTGIWSAYEFSAQEVLYRNLTTYTSATLGLECEILSGAVVVAWTEALAIGGEADLFFLSVSSKETTDGRQGDKYDNFDHTLNPTTFYNLIITNVTKDDGGQYLCDNTPGGDVQYQVDVEVPGAVSIKNGSEDMSTLTVTVGEVYEITCSAKGTKSKKDLFFDWEPDLEGGTVDSQQNAEDADLIDYTITSRYRPRKEDTIITCQLNGYVTQREIKDSVFDSITLNVRCPTKEPITTTEEISTTVTTNINDSPGINNGLIAACSIIAVIFVAALVFVLVILIRRYQIGPRRGGVQSFPKEATKDGTDNNAYMDLQEMGNEKSRDTDDLQIPERNVKLISILPGNGLLQYHKVLITRTQGNQEGVVRTLSDNSTLAAIKILRSEVQENLKLGNDSNIVQLFGWCDTVPTFAMFELVRGRNLSNYLQEEFSPHSVHTYGNTKKKTFHVSEKGNIDVLPKYALHVARGIQFLTKNKFLHPGLRAKKVLLDTTGNCKLYNFVSLENAKELTRLIWSESVPYQWMPPEFLFLGVISSAGDIWSFGVLLWEIFSYGSEPYIGQTRSDVERKIRLKELLYMPNNCPGAIWQLMLSCWQSSAEERLPIDDITARLTSMCHQDKEYQEIR